MYSVGPNRELLAAHVLAALARAATDERFASLDDVASEIGARRADVRRVISTLHEQGLVDALCMRLTLEGLAIGHALARATLRPLRATGACAARAA